MAYRAKAPTTSQLPFTKAAHIVRCPRLTTVSRPAIMTFIQDLLKPGGGIALIPFIRGTIATLLVLVM